MATNTYLPRKDKDKAVWLTNFANKLPTHSATLAVTAAELSRVQNDALLFAYMISLVETFTTEKEERVNFKNILRDGPVGTPVGDFPEMPTIANPPLVEMVPGIFPRVSQLIARIKKHTAYTTATGTDLGIIGAEQVIDIPAMKPVLKLVLNAGKVEVQWKKGDASAIRIEVIRTGTAFTFLAIDTEPDYIDTAALPATSGVWKYRAMYLISDELVGQWSDVVSISVGA